MRKRKRKRRTKLCNPQPFDWGLVLGGGDDTTTINFQTPRHDVIVEMNAFRLVELVVELRRVAAEFEADHNTMAKVFHGANDAS